ncbi:hypothetical protein MHY87_13835 [Microvirga sp. ACRRW]|uniref:hypothetical protein n=1 Tax=Microvirga sp. ACRRW TaxID=2918205 RepID=UPI001EF4D88A|nr:hypothetical protein [Microvirga sp. ACRRW]MCG7393987.1 hypothetical protein [Microvirga sp. ACRRW]
MIQRFKTRWNNASRKERIALVGAPIFVAVVTLIHAEFTEQNQPLNREAFVKGCLSSTSGLSEKAVKSYCECTADGMTPDMWASARKGTPQLTPEISQLAQTCSRKLVDAGN